MIPIPDTIRAQYEPGEKRWGFGAFLKTVRSYKRKAGPLGYFLTRSAMQSDKPEHIECYRIDFRFGWRVVWPTSLEDFMDLLSSQNVDAAILEQGAQVWDMFRLSTMTVEERYAIQASRRAETVRQRYLVSLEHRAQRQQDRLRMKEQNPPVLREHSEEKLRLKKEAVERRLLARREIEKQREMAQAEAAERKQIARRELAERREREYAARQIARYELREKLIDQRQAAWAGRAFQREKLKADVAAERLRLKLERVYERERIRVLHAKQRKDKRSREKTAVAQNQAEEWVRVGSKALNEAVPLCQLVDPAKAATVPPSIRAVRNQVCGREFLHEVLALPDLNIRAQAGAVAKALNAMPGWVRVRSGQRHRGQLQIVYRRLGTDGKPTILADNPQTYPNPIPRRRSL